MRLRHYRRAIQEAIRIDRRIADTNFVVEMRAGGPAGNSDIAQEFTAAQFLAFRHTDLGKMSVVGLVTVAVVHDHQPAGANWLGVN